jgi:hypothetical protein
LKKTQALFLYATFLPLRTLPLWERGMKEKNPSLSLFYNIKKVKEIMEIIRTLMTENILLII